MSLMKVIFKVMSLVIEGHLITLLITMMMMMMMMMMTMMMAMMMIVILMSLIIGGHLITLLITAKGRESRAANSSFCSLECRCDFLN